MVLETGGEKWTMALNSLMYRYQGLHFHHTKCSITTPQTSLIYIYTYCQNGKSILTTFPFQQLISKLTSLLDLSIQFRPSSQLHLPYKLSLLTMLLACLVTLCHDTKFTLVQRRKQINCVLFIYSHSNYSPTSKASYSYC